VAGRRGTVLGPQRNDPHRAISRARAAAVAAGRAAHFVARPSGGGATARRRLGRASAGGGGRFVRGVSPGTAPAPGARAALAGRQSAVWPPAAWPPAAAERSATDGALAARAGDPTVRR